MRKVILRTCAYLREVKDRQNLFRVVKTPNHEINIDLTYILPGRGAYLSKDKDLIIKAKSKRLIEKHLRVNDCQAVYDQLLELL